MEFKLRFSHERSFPGSQIEAERADEEITIRSNDSARSSHWCCDDRITIGDENSGVRFPQHNKDGKILQILSFI